jgi:hypothetical protein
MTLLIDDATYCASAARCYHRAFTVRRFIRRQHSHGVAAKIRHTAIFIAASVLATLAATLAKVPAQMFQLEITRFRRGLILLSLLSLIDEMLILNWLLKFLSRLLTRLFPHLI